MSARMQKGRETKERPKEANPRARARGLAALVELREYQLRRAEYIKSGLTGALAALLSPARLAEVQWYLAEQCVKEFPITDAERAVDEVPF